MQKYSNSPKPTNGLDFYIAKNQRYQQYPIKKGDFRNETGKNIGNIGNGAAEAAGSEAGFHSKKAPQENLQGLNLLAERVGFEPTVVIRHI